jgi:hypothetical protein
LSKKNIKRDSARSARRSELILIFISSGGVVQVFMHITIVHQSRGQYSLSKLRRKRGVEALSTGFAGEYSETKIFEHLENFLSLGEQRISRRGEKINFILSGGSNWDCPIGV